MASFLTSILSIIAMAELVLGNVANIFIALVNCSDYIKEGKISLVDQILTALAVSRIGLFWVILTHWCATVFNPANFIRQAKFIIIAWTIANHFATWLATTLSIFYVLKIPSFSNLIFLHLKQKVKSVLVIVLLATLGLLFTKFMMINIGETLQVKNLHEGNLTLVTILNDTASLNVMIFFTLENAIPFTVSLICFLLLIYSLGKHLRRMKLHGNRSQDPSTMVHVKALYTVVSFLLLFTVFFLSLLISGWNVNRPLNEPFHLLCQAIGILYPSIHSYVLIWANKKLKDAFMLVMVKVRDLLKKREPSSLVEPSSP